MAEIAAEFLLEGHHAAALQTFGGDLRGSRRSELRGECRSERQDAEPENTRRRRTENAHAAGLRGRGARCERAAARSYAGSLAGSAVAGFAAFLPRRRITNLRLVSCKNDSIFELSLPRRKFQKMRKMRPGWVKNDVM